MEGKPEATTLSVHRCRFVDYAPSAITALAFPPLPLPSIKGKKKIATSKKPQKFGLLAVGHANGNIDICEWMGAEGEPQCSQAWVPRKTLPGPYPSKVDSLAFVIRHPDDLNEDDIPTQSDLRLFSSGGGSELIEWDLERSCIRRTIGSQGGSIWSVAANPASTFLALGCEDGTIRLLSVANDDLTHSRRFDRVKCRMLSIAWGPPTPRTPKPKAKPNGSSYPASDSDASDSDDDEDGWVDSWLVTGGSDSSLRKWDVATGRVVERMGVDKMRNERTLVWTVGVLGDGTIISGDSLGMVKFWDPRTCTQIHTFQAHGADVLSMTISPEGKVVYTAGVDQKIVQFSLVKTSSSTAKSTLVTQWTQSTSRRMHSHDVRALAIWPPHTALPATYRRQFQLDVAPVLASGGLDMSIVLTPAALPTSTVVKVTNPLSTSIEATFEDAYHRKLGYVPQGAVKVAKKARLVSCLREAGLTVWRIQKKPSEDTDEEEDKRAREANAALQEVDPDRFAGGWEKVLEMDLVVHSNVIAHEISDDGRWLAVSDLYETKLFALRQDDEAKMKVTRIKDLTSILQGHIPSSSSSQASFTGARAFRFSPDSTKLVISTSLSGYVLVLDLTDDKPRVLRRFDHHRHQSSIVRNRVVKGRPSKKASPHLNGHIDGDVEMSNASDVEKEKSQGEENLDEEDEEEESEVESSAKTTHVDVSCIAISTDGQWLATTDSHSRTHIYNLDSISYHTTLPSFHRPAQTLVFDPTHPSVLLLAFPDNTIQIYDVETRQFPQWGKDLSSSLPRNFRHAHEPILGVSFDPPAEDLSLNEEERRSKYLLFWSSSWLFKVGLETRAMTRRAGGKKRRYKEDASRGANGVVPPSSNDLAGGEIGEELGTSRDFKMITQYRPIACCEFLNKEELVVVERPLVDVLAMLPPAYFKSKYGAS